MKFVSLEHWIDYELIDSGGFEKLERFGKYILYRPEPQAIWKKALPQEQWENMAHAIFRREQDKTRNSLTIGEGWGGVRGEWILKKDMPQQWWINYEYSDMKLRFRLGLTAFKHVGLFPEQAENWNYIYETICEMRMAGARARASLAPTCPHPRVLNLFAYTGGASLSARAAGAEVTHVDSVRQTVNWSRENMEASGFNNIRWIVDDAMKFMRREVKREKQYECIILDPPAYGRGPDGEKWILEEGINELMDLVANCYQTMRL